MPDAPYRPCKIPGCSAFAAAGSRCCERHRPVAAVEIATSRARLDAARGSAHERGYTGKWSNYARAFRARFPISPGYLTRTPFWTPAHAMEFHARRTLAAREGRFLEFMCDVAGDWSLCSQLSTLNLCFTFHPSRGPERGEEVDHIVPVAGPADPLFWQEWNHQALSKRQHSEKTATHDGGFRGSVRPAPHLKPVEAGIA